MDGPDPEREQGEQPPAPALFIAWFLVGSAGVLGILSILTIGLPVIVAAVVGAVVLSRRTSTAAGLPGIVCGAAVPLFYVAYLNRGGPGEVCSTTAAATECVEQWSPWPTLTAGLLLLVGGATWFARQRRHEQA